MKKVKRAYDQPTNWKIRMADVLDVLLHGKTIGQLARVREGLTRFSFREDYTEDSQRPTLSLSFKNELGGLLLRGSRSHARGGKLTPFFSNLLPEGPLRQYLARRAGLRSEQEFLILKALGLDLPGAVSVRSQDDQEWGEGQPDSQVDTTSMASENHPLRFSLAGVQFKFSASLGKENRLTIPVAGVGGSWILKLASLSPHYDSLPENEFSMMTLARHVGIEVPRFRLVASKEIDNLPQVAGSEGQIFAIERFDRLSGSGAIHAEDFAQVFNVHPERKYEGDLSKIATVIANEAGYDDLQQFIRRIVFSALIGNGDMHLKNWAFIYPDERHAALSPAYDFLCTLPYVSNEKLSLMGDYSSAFSNFSADYLKHLSAEASLPLGGVLEAARETVDLFHQHWEAEKRHLPVPSTIVDAIDQHLRTVPIAKGV